MEKELQPTQLPVKCVVCNGFGTVNYGKKECHACQGRGYILVPVKEIDAERVD
jgi:DnaJ-class molecular chaperone